MGFLSALFPPSTSVAEAHEAAKRRRLVLLDVREPREWKAGHAPGAKNIPLSKLETRRGDLQPGTRYCAICRTGARSRRATAQLRKAGFDVVNLQGGMNAWQRNDLPLEPRNGRIV